MQGINGILFHGLLKSTAVIVSNDAPAAVIIAARLASVFFGARIQICDGVNDHLEVQAGLNALPAAGGEVYLLEGRFFCEDTVDLDSHQTLRGCGENSVITTTTADTIFLSAVGGAGTELTGIVIEDIKIDGGASLGDTGIWFEYVDYSIIQNVFIRTMNSPTGGWLSGVWMTHADHNKLLGNTLTELTGNYAGIALEYCDTNILSGNSIDTGENGMLIDNSPENIVSTNTLTNLKHGVQLDHTSPGTVVDGNFFEGNEQGIYTKSDYNIISNNQITGSLNHGILMTSADHNLISDNYIIASSQDATNTYDDILVQQDSNYNTFQDNVCRAGTLANKPRYGINIKDANCDENRVIDNDLYDDGFATLPYNDGGTGTKHNIYEVPFSDGSDPQDSGYLIDLGGEYARAWLRLPEKVVQVVRMKVYARSVVAEADKMRGEFVVYGGADNEAYNTHNGSVANHPSTSSNFAADDVIFWTLATAGVLALLGGDSVEVKVLHEAAGGLDCATNAYFRTVEIEYV